MHKLNPGHADLALPVSVDVKDCLVFSLVVATVNRVSELDALLHSLANQSVSLSCLEVIVVDQNKRGEIDHVIEKYASRLNVVHIKSSMLGGSHNRNIGLARARGEIVAFPDDDCEYEEDTLLHVLRMFRERPNIRTILGRVLEKGATDRNVIRDWPAVEKVVNRNNFFPLYSMITVFTRRTDKVFDEKLGIGEMFGAYEDADYVASLIGNEPVSDVIYTPEIRVRHPKLSIAVMDCDKVRNYGRGFGAFCRKNLSLYLFVLFSSALMYHFGYLLLALLRANGLDIKKRWTAITSRIAGFREYTS